MDKENLSDYDIQVIISALKEKVNQYHQYYNCITNFKNNPSGCSGSDFYLQKAREYESLISKVSSLLGDVK